MSRSEQERSASNSVPPDESLRMAVAISLLRSKLLQKQNQSSPYQNSDALRWKRKAKDRKQELLRLRQDLKEAEDASQCDLFPQSASCKCYFFDNLGKLSKLSPNRLPEASQCRFNDVLRRRFLRQVRFKERRRRTGGSSHRHQFSDINSEDEMELLRASVDFLVELCETGSPVEEASFSNWSHQAVDFILASLKNLLARAKSVDLIEGIISSLIRRMVTRMCCPLQGNASKQSDSDAQFFVQHLIRKLGSDPYIGQRVLFAVSQRVSVLAENFLFSDPFDDAFTNMHQCMFLLERFISSLEKTASYPLCSFVFIGLRRIQLIEFLVSDYLSVWSKDEGFDTVLFEEWVASVLHARKALELLESRNGLYALYMDRVIGELAKHVSLTMSLQKLKREILDKLFH